MAISEVGVLTEHLLGSVLEEIAHRKVGGDSNLG